MAEFCDEHCDKIIGTVDHLMKLHHLNKKEAELLRSAWLVSDGSPCEECGTAYLFKQHKDGPKEEE